MFTLNQCVQTLSCNCYSFLKITMMLINISKQYPVTYLPTTLVDSLENKNSELTDIDSAKESLEAKESYLDRCRIVCNEISLISNIFKILQVVDEEGVVSVAPGEEKKLMSTFKDKHFEELFVCWQRSILINCSQKSRI